MGAFKFEVWMDDPPGEHVRRAADLLGMDTEEFIYQAALEKADRVSEAATVANAVAGVDDG